MAIARESDEARAKAWLDGRLRRICDVAEPGAHGSVFRAHRYPDYWDFNVLRVEGDSGIPAGDLIAAADEALADCRHRRIDFDDVVTGDRLRDDFTARGWRTLRLVLMRHDGGSSEPAGLTVEEVAYDDVAGLRRAWHEEDFPDQEPTGYHEQAREVAMAHGARVLAARRDGEVVGFAQLEVAGDGAEITQVFVLPEHRGGGLGTAITRASIAAAGAVPDLWIAADDEDRPKELYARLGFRPAWLSMEMTRLPDPVI